MKRALLLVLSYLALLQFVAPVLVMIPYTILQLIETGTTDSALLMEEIAVPSHLCTGLIVVAASVGYSYHKKEQRAFRMFPKGGVFFLSLVAMAILVLLMEPLLSFLQLSDNSEVRFDRLLDNWVGILAVAVVGPIAEELVFRKHVLHALTPHYTPSVSILLSALLFGLMHLNPAQILPAFILGGFLAWLYERTDSILLTSLLHIANNSVSIVMIARYGFQVEVIPAGLPWGISWTIWILGLIVLGICVHAIRLQTQRERRYPTTL